MLAVPWMNVIVGTFSAQVGSLFCARMVPRCALSAMPVSARVRAFPSVPDALAMPWPISGNDAELPELMRWAHGRGMDLTVIETMPMGEIDVDRTDQYLPLSVLRADLQRQFTLADIPYKTGGPARYVEVAETGGRLGFITPMTHNFCESCNRVRLTCTGTLYMCLGQEDAADLRAPLRASEGNELLSSAIDEAIGRKPKGHDFIIDRRSKRPAVSRHMSVTGG